MRRIFILVGLVAVARAAHAQPDFSDVKLTVGQAARIEEDGVTLHGQVVSVATDAIVVGNHTVRPGPGLRIDRDRGHTGWKGLGIGAAVGAVGGVKLPAGAFWGALIGASMDQYVPVYDTRTFTLTAP